MTVLADNVLALLRQRIEHAHRHSHPELELDAAAAPASATAARRRRPPQLLLKRLLLLGSRLRPKQLATSKRKPTSVQAKGCVNSSIARSHVSTARIPSPSRHCTVAGFFVFHQTTYGVLNAY